MDRLLFIRRGQTKIKRIDHSKCKDIATQKMPVRHFYLLSHYICYSLFFLFSVFWLQVNEFNSMWEDKGENIRSLLLARKVSRPEEKNDILRQYNDKFIYTPSRSAQNHRPPNNVRPAEGYIRISHNLPSPSPFISPKTIEFIPSGAKEQKKEIIPYPRCGFGACLRCA